MAYDDEIKRAKELERQKWLADLEAQKKEKLVDSQRRKLDDENFELKKQAEIRQSWNSPRGHNPSKNELDSENKVPAAMRTSINFGVLKNLI